MGLGAYQHQQITCSPGAMSKNQGETLINQITSFSLIEKKYRQNIEKDRDNNAKPSDRPAEQLAYIYFNTFNNL